jgi:hypothetical protein
MNQSEIKEALKEIQLWRDKGKQKELTRANNMAERDAKSDWFCLLWVVLWILVAVVVVWILSALIRL